MNRFTRWLSFRFGGPVVKPVVKESDQKLLDHPHLYDVHHVERPERAVVFLHGGGGSKGSFAYSLGLTGQRWARGAKILADQRTMAVFPQGRNVPSAPRAATWTNHVMRSGADDKTFLYALAWHIRKTYGVQRVYLAGHSMGGCMVNRMWYESPGTFDGYVAIAGPPSVHFSGRAPFVGMPYLAILGDNDTVLRNQEWGAAVWTIRPALGETNAFVNPNVLGEQALLPHRLSVAAADSPTQVRRVAGGGHSIGSLETASDTYLLDTVVGFVGGL